MKLSDLDDDNAQVVDVSSVDPEHLDALEKSLLVYAMTNVVFAQQVFSIIRPDDFSNSEHQKIAAALIKILKNKPANYGLVYLGLEFKEHGVDVDLDEYIVYAGDIKSDDVAYQVAQKIHEIALKKKLQTKLAAATVDMKNLPVADALEILKQIELEIAAELVGEDTSKDLDTVLNGLEDFLLSNDMPIIYNIGVPAIDRNIVDFANHNLAIVGARPGVGKTALLVRSAYTNAAKGYRVHFFSLEMNEQQLGARFFSIASKIPPSFLLSKRAQIDPTALKLYMSRIKSLPLKVSMPGNKSLMHILQAIRESHIRYGTQIFYVDYLQLIQTKGRQRYEEVGLISTQLALLARELGVAIVAASQLGRSDKNEPTMDNLRESGNIEQDASLILLMYKPKEPIGTQQEHEELRIKIEKQRNGTNGLVFPIAFDPSSTHFYEIIQEQEDEDA